MGRTVILTEQRFASHEAILGYSYDIEPIGFNLVPGETYTVYFDGEEYQCVAIDASAVMEGYFIAGNASSFGLPGNNEPFGLITLSEWDGMTVVCLEDNTPTEHTIAIYQVIEDDTDDDTQQPENPPDETPEGIVLKDRNGNDVAYYGIETVTFDTTTPGKQQTYSKGVVTPKLEVPVTFADGDMPITADENTLIKELVLLKPETLVPENIRAGVNVAAVTGGFIGDTEEATVELAMADGDQVVEPSDEGKVLSKVTITKPETLLPENIAEGVDIAGIIGTLALCKTRTDFTLNDSGQIVGATVYGDNLPPFYRMETLEWVDLTNCQCTSFQNYAFYTCPSLASIVIPDSVISIGNAAFYSCSALTSAVIGDSVETIADTAFRNCTKLTSIVIPDSVTSIGANSFTGTKLDNAVFEDATGWYVTTTKDATSGTTLSSSALANPSTAAEYLINTYKGHYWYKK